MGQWAMSVWGVHKTTLKYAQMGTHVKYLTTHDHGKKYMHLQGWLNRSREDNFGKLWQIKGCAELQYYNIQNISAHNTQKTQNPPKRASAN